MLRLLEHLAAEMRTCTVSPRAFHFLIAHAAAAPFTLIPLARHLDPTDPPEPAAVAAHTDLMADLIIRALQLDPTEHAATAA
jgi:TetR/AcrR family transcriptional regulator